VWVNVITSPVRSYIATARWPSCRTSYRCAASLR
jgi:hypothetical protein